MSFDAKDPFFQTTVANLVDQRIQRSQLAALVRQLQNGVSTAEKLAIIRGSVNGSGTILAGSGFSVVHSGTGLFTVTFTTPMGGIPSVTGSSSSGQRIFNADTQTTAGFRATLYFGGALVDVPFDFVAVGAR